MYRVNSPRSWFLVSDGLVTDLKSLHSSSLASCLETTVLSETVKADSSRSKSRGGRKQMVKKKSLSLNIQVVPFCTWKHKIISPRYF